MKLEGIHHVTAITADARSNLGFYTGVLGLRLVKKTVNQDDPNVYHLFYGDEQANPGSDTTFFEYPGAPRGRAGNGMAHTVVWRVQADEALQFWSDRLAHGGVDVDTGGGRFRFSDPDGIVHELSVTSTSDAPLVAEHPEIPAELALQGFDGVRAYSASPDASRSLLEETLGFEPRASNEWLARGDERSGFYVYDQPPHEPGSGGPGTIHHVAFASATGENEAWRRRVAEAGRHPSPVIDRFWFRSVYFREPSGVLFELATMGPGFATDEPLESLGDSLSLPPSFESRREEIERTLTPLPNPRAAKLP